MWKMFGKPTNTEQTMPNGKPPSRRVQFLYCYLLMALGSVIGVLLADGFRWHEWWQAVYAHAVCAVVFPVVAAIFGLLAIAVGIVALIENSSVNIPIKLICILGGILYFRLWFLAVRHSFWSCPLWQRWAWRAGLVASSALATYIVLYMTASC